MADPIKQYNRDKNLSDYRRDINKLPAQAASGFVTEGSAEEAASLQAQLRNEQDKYELLRKDAGRRAEVQREQLLNKAENNRITSAKSKEEVLLMTAGRALSAIHRDYSTKLGSPDSFDRQTVIKGGYREEQMPIRSSQEGALIVETFVMGSGSMQPVVDDPSGGVVGQVIGVPVPAVGQLARIRLIVLTAGTAGAMARLVITSRAFDNSADGFARIREQAQFVWYDTDAPAGARTIAVDAVGIALDQIFAGKAVYFNNDEVQPNNTSPGWTPLTDQNQSKKAQLYAYLQVGGLAAPGEMVCLVQIIVQEAT